MERAAWPRQVWQNGAMIGRRSTTLLALALLVACDKPSNDQGKAKVADKAPADEAPADEAPAEASPASKDADAAKAPGEAPPPAPAETTPAVSLSDMSAKLIDLSKREAPAELAAMSDAGRGVIHRHSADGKAGSETTLESKDGAALAKNFSGDEFSPLHYVGEALNELADPSRAETLKIDEAKLTISYEGISGMWGVRFGFHPPEGGGLVLTRIETWDEAP